jgi:hypothetical protein
MKNTITLDVANNGHIEIKTKLKEIPVEVAQKLLDEAIAVIVQTYIPDEQKHLIAGNFLAAKMWRAIAFTQLIVTGILMIIFKVGR